MRRQPLPSDPGSLHRPEGQRTPVPGGESAPVSTHFSELMLARGQSSPRAQKLRLELRPAGSHEAGEPQKLAMHLSAMNTAPTALCQAELDRVLEDVWDLGVTCGCQGRGKSRAGQEPRGLNRAS